MADYSILNVDAVFKARVKTIVLQGITLKYYFNPPEKEITENDLSTAQIILIDRVTTKLGVIRCIEEHVRESSVMVGQELAPSLKASYLAYNNSVRLDLQALGINTRKGEEVLTPLKYIEQFDKEKTKEKENKR